MDMPGSQRDGRRRLGHVFDHFIELLLDIVVVSCCVDSVSDCCTRVRCWGVGAQAHAQAHVQATGPLTEITARHR
jgi:hypothetical protein